MGKVTVVRLLGLSLLFGMASISLLHAKDQTIRVSTVVGFLEALGSDRTIILEPGEYDLATAIRRKGENFHFRRNADGRELVIHHLTNLKIRGSKERDVHLLTKPSYGTVLCFEHCDGIVIDDLRAGHGPSREYCIGGVIAFDSCSQILCRNLRLYGSGNDGFFITNCRKFYCKNTVIEECQVNIMYIGQSTDLVFKDCIFRENEKIQLIWLNRVAGLSYLDCRFESNNSQEDFFQMDTATVVTIRGGSFSGNTCQHLAHSSRDLKLIDVQILDNNHFLQSRYAADED